MKRAKPTLANPMVKAYRQWCKDMDPDYRVKDYPLRGMMFDMWCAAWTAALVYAYKGEV